MSSRRRGLELSEELGLLLSGVSAMESSILKFPYVDLS